MSEDFNEFRRRVLKVTGKRKHKISHSLGGADAFTWGKKNKLLTEKIRLTEFLKIVRTVNNIMAEDLADSKDVKFPQHMGQLEVRKICNYIRIIDGELHTNRKIDWAATLKLWSTDEEARESKFLVRTEDPERFIIFYNKVIANYNNKSMMAFKPNRELTIRINNRAKEGLIDAYTIGKNYGK